MNAILLHVSDDDDDGAGDYDNVRCLRVLCEKSASNNSCYNANVQMFYNEHLRNLFKISGVEMLYLWTTVRKVMTINSRIRINENYEWI